MKKMYLTSCFLLSDWAASAVCADPVASPLAVYVQGSASEVWGNGQTENQLTQSATRIKQQEIRKVGSDRLEDFADTIPGVQLGRFQAGIGSDVYLRGFPLGGQFFLDGLLDKRGYFVRDPATIERVEIFKGADSVLFGAGSPGGVVNYVAKKPVFESFRTLRLETGSPARSRVVYDSTGGIPRWTDWAYRTVFIHQDAATGQKNVGDERLTLFPSLLYQTDKDELQLAAEFNRQQREYDFDHVFVNGKPIYNVSYVDPRTEAKRDSLRLSARHERQWGHGWDSRLGVNWIGMDRYDRIAGFDYLDAADKPLPGYYRRINEDSQQYHLKAELGKQWQTGSWEHKIRIGAEQRYAGSEVVSGSCADCFQLDIFNPVFDYPMPTDQQLTPNNYRTMSRETAGFLQHSLSQGNAYLTLGLRSTRLAGDVRNTDTGVQSREVAVQDNQVSLGISHKLGENGQIFANRNESLQPNAGHDRYLKPLPPQQGVQHELGMRYQTPTHYGKSLKVSASVYQINQDNLTVRDPVDRAARMLSGSATVRGAELTLKTPVSPKLGVELAYHYAQAKLMQQDKTTDLHNIPQHQASLKLDYRPNERNQWFFGATHVGKRPGDDANSFTVPAYTRLDAGFEHKLNKKVTLNVGVRNLLDEDYVATSEAVDFIVQGRKRTVTMGLDVAF